MPSPGRKGESWGSLAQSMWLLRARQTIMKIVGLMTMIRMGRCGGKILDGMIIHRWSILLRRWILGVLELYHIWLSLIYRTLKRRHWLWIRNNRAVSLFFPVLFWSYTWFSTHCTFEESRPNLPLGIVAIDCRGSVRRHDAACIPCNEDKRIKNLPSMCGREKWCRT